LINYFQWISKVKYNYFIFKITCLKCKNKSVVKEKYLDLSLEI